MKRVAKPEGKFNVVLEDAPMPAVGPHDVRVRNVRSLISRGSELWRRYIRPEAVDPQIMGYSVAGVVDAVGAEVMGFAPGDRVGVSGPHAQFVVQDSRVASLSEGPKIVRIPDALDFEQATFWPLTTSAVMWIDNDDIQPDDTVVIVGQGLVGSLLLQVARANGQGRLVAVDALPNRCALAAEVEADEVINASDEDPVAQVLELTDGRGADVVIYAVGGRAGLRAFDQAQRMTGTGGLLQVVGLYEDDPLPLSSSYIQRKRLIGGALPDSNRVAASARSLDLLTQGRIATDRMVTHRFPYRQAPEAFHFLHDHPEAALGVLISWDD
ncbi:MAG: zinc-binding dehydrogenase [Chloroflexota bacterium]|nr:zinc-binding dehydrogenase [Chloroflexota bacterium]